MTETTESQITPLKRFCGKICGPKLRATAFGIPTGVSIGLLLFSCTLIMWRLVFQMILIFCLGSVAFHAYTGRLLLRRINAEDPTQMGRVLKTRTFQAINFPRDTQPMFCWVQLVSEYEVEVGSNLCDDNEDETEDNLTGIPTVVVNAEDGVQRGDRLLLSLVEGDPAQLYYLPFQRKILERIKWDILKMTGWCVVALIALYVFYPGVPFLFASSQQVEDSINTSWTDLDDDDDNDGEGDGKVCHVHWYVTIAYDVLFALFVGIPLAVGLYLRWKHGHRHSEEDPMIDMNYRLMSGASGEDTCYDEKTPAETPNTSRSTMLEG